MVNDRYVIPALIGGTILMVLLVFAIFIYIFVQKSRQGLFEREKQQMLFDHGQSLMVAKIEERERTMNNISSNIHDHLSQLLSFAQTNLKAAEETNGLQETLHFIHITNNLLSEIAEGLHNIGHSLNSDFVRKHGLIKVLTKELEYLESVKHLAMSMDIEGEYIPLDAEKELLIYRIAQEAIHNAVKHAGAGTIKILLYYSKVFFSIKVSDDGIGFDKNTVSALNGIGMINMQQRAKLLGAQLDIISSPGAGCTVLLHFNLEKIQEASL